MTRLTLPAFAIMALANWASAQTLTSPANLGMPRGATREFTLTGTQLAASSGILTNAPGITFAITKTAEKELTVKATAKADVPIGLYAMYVVTPNGLTNARPFCVDALPEVAEGKDNTTVDKAFAVSSKTVVTGTATAEVGDFFRISLKPNEKLSVEVLARRLGSPMDPAIFVYDAKTKRELPALYADDTLGLQGDCRTVLQFPQGGDFVLEVRDMTYKGGADYAYRLRIGDFPSAATASPLAISQDEKPVKVGFAGLDVKGLTPLALSAPGNTPCIWATPMLENKSPGWPVVVKAVPYPVTVEEEPNDDPKQATKVLVPGAVSAGFGKKGDVDHYTFPAKRGTAYILEATAAEHGAPTEILLTVSGPDGKTVATSDTQKPTARIEYTAAADGMLTVKAEHTNYLFGPLEVYLLTIRPNTPDFEVTLASERIDIPGDGVGAVVVSGITRTAGFKGEVTILVNGDVVGNLGEATTFPCALGVKAKPGLGVVEARATIDGKVVTKRATCPDAVKATFGTLPVPPADWGARVAICNLPRDTVYLANDKTITLEAGATVKFKVTRTGKVKDTATVTLAGLSAGVTAKPATFAVDKTETEVEVTAKADVVNANYRPTLKITQGNTVSVTIAPPIEVKGKKETKPKAGAKP